MTDPVEQRDDLPKEAARGRSQRAPFIAWGGVIGVIATAFLVFLAIAFALYFLL